MGWLSASTRKISDNYMNLLQADKDESQANCEKQTKSVLVKVLWNTNMNTIRREGYH